MANYGGGKCLRIGTERFSETIEVSFPSRATDHQRADLKESRSESANRIHQHLHLFACAGSEVLIEQEERLDRANGLVLVEDGKIPIIEYRLDSVLYDFVIAMILPVARKCLMPSRAIWKLMAGEDPHARILGGYSIFDRIPCSSLDE